MGVFRRIGRGEGEAAYLVFRLGEIWAAFDVGCVVEVVQLDQEVLTACPMASSSASGAGFLGMVEYRRGKLPVYDLQALLDSPGARSCTSRGIVIEKAGRGPVGIVAAGRRMHFRRLAGRPEPSPLELSPPFQHFLPGAMDDGEDVVVVDAQRLIAIWEGRDDSPAPGGGDSEAGVRADPALVLLTEDNPVSALAVEKVLGKRGFEVMAAATAAEARRAWETAVHAGRLPGWVLMDVKLPDGDGVELLESFLGEVPPGCVVKGILMTASPGEVDAPPGVEVLAKGQLERLLEILGKGAE